MKRALLMAVLGVSSICSAAYNDCCYCDSRLQVGANYTYLNLTPGGEGSFNGSLGGLQALYEYRPLNSIYAGAKFSWQDGSVNNDSLGRRKIDYITAEERIGYTFGVFCNSASVTLFSGLGYHYLWQGFKPTGDSPIDFTYSQFYAPIGVLLNKQINSCFAVGLNCIWMPQFYSSVGLHPIEGAYWTLENTLENVLVELPLDYTLTRDGRFHIMLVPFYEHWQDGPSVATTTTGISLGLPRNYYDFYGVNLNISYCF